MSTSERKRNANRLNGQKSRGPKDTSATRYNARKHGLLSVGVTELDDAAGYRSILRRLRAEKRPVGIIEEFFVESLAIDIVRTRRARRMEAGFITSVMNPPKRDHGLSDVTVVLQDPVLDPGIPAAIEPKNAEMLVNLYVRYESTCSHRARKYLLDLERVQGQRKSEKVAAPETIDAHLQIIPLGTEAPSGTGTCSPDTPKFVASDPGGGLDATVSKIKTVSTGEQRESEVSPHFAKFHDQSTNS
jgi:hypothetical protein